MPFSSQARARAADVPPTSRTGTPRGGGRSVPPITPTYPHPGWPDMPSELTGWRFGTPYPIPLEPPLPDHRYVRDPDSPPVCFTALIYQSDTWTFIPLLIVLHLYLQPPIEYVDEMLGVLAALEGMVLRRETHLSVMGVQVPFILFVFITLLMTHWF